MNSNEFMSKKNYKKLNHNEPYETTLQSYNLKETKNGFMIAFNFAFIDQPDRIESHNAHYSKKTINEVDEQGNPTQKINENDQITPFIKRLLSKTPQVLQDECDGRSNQEILDELVGLPFTIYPIHSTYEYNGQMRNQRDFWLDPKPENQENQETQENGEENEF